MPCPSAGEAGLAACMRTNDGGLSIDHSQVACAWLNGRARRRLHACHAPELLQQAADIIPLHYPLASTSILPRAKQAEQKLTDALPCREESLPAGPPLRPLLTGTAWGPALAWGRAGLPEQAAAAAAAAAGSQEMSELPAPAPAMQQLTNEVPHRHTLNVIRSTQAHIRRQAAQRRLQLCCCAM